MTKAVTAALWCAIILWACPSGGVFAATDRAEAASAGAKNAPADISRDIVDATMARLPFATDHGKWEYSQALFLLGDISVYDRTHEPQYLDYAKAWADFHIDSQGVVDRPIDALDFVMPGNVAISLYRETGDKKYKLAADRVAEILKDYPKTGDGGLWHAKGSGREHQLWLDGTFMAEPFIVRYGALTGHQDAAITAAVQQLSIYGLHLHDENGPLYFHAYDSSGQASWADPVHHHSPVKWSRAIGWYCMSLVDVLEAMPASPAHEKQNAERQELIKLVQDAARDLVALQDPTTGLWFQIIDQPKLKGNFLETSGSSMFTYFLDSAVNHGYIDSRYRSAAQHGYQGVLSKVILGPDGHYHVTDICEGTNVDDQVSYYLTRERHTDDFHGLGAFLLMNEELLYHRSIMDDALPAHDMQSQRP